MSYKPIQHEIHFTGLHCTHLGETYRVVESIGRAAILRSTLHEIAVIADRKQKCDDLMEEADTYAKQIEQMNPDVYYIHLPKRTNIEKIDHLIIFQVTRSYGIKANQ